VSINEIVGFAKGITFAIARAAGLRIPCGAGPCVMTGHANVAKDPSFRQSLPRGEAIGKMREASQHDHRPIRLEKGALHVGIEQNDPEGASLIRRRF
jgi:hypothetical protein